MKKILLAAAVAIFAMGYSANATLIINGSTGALPGNAPNTGDDLTIAYTVDLTSGVYTYTYMLSTSPSEILTSFTVGGTTPIITTGLSVLPGSQSTYLIVANNSVTFFLPGVSSGTVSYSSSYGPGYFGWGMQDAGVTWNNPPLIPAPTAVPEASTTLAGLLMIVPLGVGAIRALRKERLA